MTADANFHLFASWGKHVQSDGSNIAPGSPDPINAGYLKAPPGSPAGLLLFNEGIAYAAYEIFTKRPLQMNTGRLQFDFDLTDLANFYTDAQINETDVKLCITGKMFNFSLQHVAKTNMIQVSKQDGGWIDSGFIAPPLAKTPVHHSIVCGFDVTTGRYGIQQVTIGGVSYLMPMRLIELTATPTTWPDGAYVQLQSCVGPNGGDIRLLYEGLTLTWS